MKRLINRNSGISAAPTTIPATTVVINPDSLRTTSARPNIPHKAAKTTKFANSSERNLALFKLNPSSQPPAAPIATPIPRRTNRSLNNPIEAVSSFNTILSTNTARIAPTGSIRTPSPSNKVATFRSTDTCLSNGPTTVGPVTTTREA